MPVKECKIISLRREYGIEGDINAQAGSPRQVLIASTPTLADFNLNPGDLGENIVIDTQVESFSSGQVLQVGKSALIRLTFICEPCANLEKIQPGLAKRIAGKRGFLGIVVKDGVIELGDEVSLTSQLFPALPDDTKGRFNEFVRRIPPGKVVKTSDLLLALGVSKAYYRTIPIFLKKASRDLPIHRIVRADGSLLSEYISEQEQLLKQEEIEIAYNRISSDSHYWDTWNFHELELL
ncbi:MGMT family protein [Planktothrix sp. FACHB-1355]|uniref:MGMT family protein n=2 Tax=Cyanophyceae TaxID=3028117 RepID=A0A926ZJH5_9CYAN|nr:MGMT family protein [Aerosakkonema funiforme FACHB-1375]MBD3557374.1 MGMT family protein [Planktothrix sp. FACHB-1355]